MATASQQLESLFKEVNRKVFVAMTMLADIQEHDIPEAKRLVEVIKQEKTRAESG